MDKQELVDKILHVKSWQSGSIRAPHKPLLLLYAFSKFLVGQQQIAFADAEPDLRNLLSDFGPPRSNHRPEYPFWRLQNDKVWDVSLTSPVTENSSGDVGRRALIDNDAHGSLSKPIKELLSKDPQLLQYLIQEMLAANFPETIHADILQALGVDLEDIDNGSRRRKRCPKFREKILQAYEYRCAVCGFDVRLGHTPIALEAAHIQWHQAGGPDSEENGLALCALHHKLFDRGAFTLSEDMNVLVSDKANGYHGFHEWLLQYHGKIIRPPQATDYAPNLQYVAWHTNEVFQGNFL